MQIRLKPVAYFGVKNVNEMSLKLLPLPALQRDDLKAGVLEDRGT